MAGIASSLAALVAVALASEGSTIPTLTCLYDDDGEVLCADHYEIDTVLDCSRESRLDTYEAGPGVITLGWHGSEGFVPRARARYRSRSFHSMADRLDVFIEGDWIAGDDLESCHRHSAFGD